RLAERVAAELQIPVYLYAKAATRPERERLPDIRKGQFEALRDRIGQDPAADPDVGPKRIHPTAGATAIGARPFLVAFNIYLDTTDVTIAKDIAKRIRASGGGLPAVQASGFEVEGKAQVSMNLLDIDTTSPAAGVPPRWRGRSPPRSSPWWRGSRSGGRLMPACSSASRRFWPKPTPCAPSSAVSRTTMPPRTRRSARPTGSRKAIPGGPVRRTKRSSGRPRRRSRWPAVPRGCSRSRTRSGPSAIGMHTLTPRSVKRWPARRSRGRWRTSG